MSFHTYILLCADGSYYVGHSDDLEQRIAQHEAGAIPGYTATRRPVRLLWSQDFASRDEALGAELQIKGWSRRKKEALIAGDFEALRTLAKKSFDTSLRQAQRRLRTNGAGGSGMAQQREDGTDAPTPPISSASVQTSTEPAEPAHPAPVIVLVRPQLGENIGKAARAMLNFGLTELRLVAPRDGWPNPDAGPSAAGADIVLGNALVFDTLAQAVADCAHVYATTVRKRGVTKPVVGPDEAARAIHAAPGRSAIVFGPERSGLETEEVALARAILTVPINPAFASLNLAQAVILCAYEWSKQAALSQPTVTDLLPPAPQDELDGMIDQLEAMLEDAGYFYPPSRVPATRRTLRTLLTKPGWNHLEVRTLRGVLSSLANPRAR